MVWDVLHECDTASCVVRLPNDPLKLLVGYCCCSVDLVLLRHICAIDALNLNNGRSLLIRWPCIAKQMVGCLIYGSARFVRCCTTLTRILGNASLLHRCVDLSKGLFTSSWWALALCSRVSMLRMSVGLQSWVVTKRSWISCYVDVRVTLTRIIDNIS
jgi:hypothetical protein